MEMRGKRGQVAKEVGDEGSFISGRGKNQPEINQEAPRQLAHSTIHPLASYPTFSILEKDEKRKSQGLNHIRFPIIYQIPLDGRRLRNRLRGKEPNFPMRKKILRGAD
ncbi:hypothetical protein RUM44_008598 [Polyplax serrata]|uniref:Uncharacterized protein n=1 Tax=Polyplax serrata TaxID=468196 RepID=A0ABR1BD55_POLSC